MRINESAFLRAEQKNGVGIILPAPVPFKRKAGNRMKDKELQVKSTSQMLEEGLAEVFSTEYFRRFLAFIANNPNYSYRNVILILQQCYHATKTMGFKSWMKEGRMVKGGEKGLRINACFEKDEDEDKDNQPQPVQSKKKRRHKGDSKFRRVSVFDISQTRDMEESDDNYGQEPRRIVPAGNIFEIARLEGSVVGYERLLEDINEISPLPIIMRSVEKLDGRVGFNGIFLNKDMSQLHTIRTITNQIARIWLRDDCSDKEQLEIMAESVAFIVCQYLNLDTSEFSFHHIAKYSLDRERNVLEKFLDVIQKTALYFIDSIDGVRTARRIGYQIDEFFLLTNRKTALRLFRQGYYIYLVYPGQGELLTMNKKDVEQYDGPFSVPRADWFNISRPAA